MIFLEGEKLHIYNTMNEIIYFSAENCFIITNLWIEADRPFSTKLNSFHQT